MKCENPNCTAEGCCIIAIMGHDKHNCYRAEIDIVCALHEHLYRQAAEHDQIYCEARLLEPAMVPTSASSADKLGEVMSLMEYNQFALSAWKLGPQIPKEYKADEQIFADAYLIDLDPRKKIK